MPCTTILVGKLASNDGSTMIARTDDGFFDEKKIIVVEPKDQPRKYKSVLQHLTIELPDNPMRYTSCPSVDPKIGVWPATGINEAHVGMTATETITSNARVLSADPLVRYQKAKTKKEKDIPGGIGEEDLVVLVLPYVHSAREGVLRLGELIEKYGTSESNGIGFNDENEVWWFESIGGHHWIAKKVEDDEYVIAPNQFAMDHFDVEDAFGEKKANLCSADLLEFVEKYHLDTNNDGKFNPRRIFGSHDDSDHVYNTPRAWFMARHFNPRTYKWDGENADFTPESDDIPWSLKPEYKITVEDVKYIMSAHFQGTPYDPYSAQDTGKRGVYRSIGINRTGVMAICQIRSDAPEAFKGVEWVCFGPCPFNVVLPLYTNVPKMPKYVSDITMTVDTTNFYWASRVIAALADPHFGTCVQLIERYQKTVANRSRAIILEYDAKLKENSDVKLAMEANEKICAAVKEETDRCLTNVLRDASVHMKCGYNRADN